MVGFLLATDQYDAIKQLNTRKRELLALIDYQTGWKRIIMGLFGKTKAPDPKEAVIYSISQL